MTGMDGIAQLPKNAIKRLAYIGMTTPDAAGLCQFYERALGFRLRAAGRLTEWTRRLQAPTVSHWVSVTKSSNSCNSIGQGDPIRARHPLRTCTFSILRLWLPT